MTQNDVPEGCVATADAIIDAIKCHQMPALSSDNIDFYSSGIITTCMETCFVPSCHASAVPVVNLPGTTTSIWRNEPEHQACLAGGMWGGWLGR